MHADALGTPDGTGRTWHVCMWCRTCHKLVLTLGPCHAVGAAAVGQAEERKALVAKTDTLLQGKYKQVSAHSPWMAGQSICAAVTAPRHAALHPQVGVHSHAMLYWACMVQVSAGQPSS